MINVKHILKDTLLFMLNELYDFNGNGAKLCFMQL